LTGSGKIDFLDVLVGLVYEGDILDFNPHGKGKMTHPSGKLYIGDFI